MNTKNDREIDDAIHDALNEISDKYNIIINYNGFNWEYDE